MANENLICSALGRLAFIGELYDVRNESLSSLSLFKKEGLNSELVQRTEVGHSEFNYSFTENISDRFELLKVEPELQLNVQLGLVKIEGSGKYLTEEKKSEKTVNCSVLCQLRTVHEKFFGSPAEILPHVDLNLLKNSKYTHVISEITWGANCILNMEFSDTGNSNKKEIQGRLEAGLTALKAITVKGGGKLEKKESDCLSGKGMNIKINADVYPKGKWPTSVEEFCELVARVPELVKEMNGGKGVPLTYVLLPLSEIRNLAKIECEIDEFICRKVDGGFLNSTIFLFEEILQMKQKLGDLHTKMTKDEKYVKAEDLRKAHQMLEELKIKESDLKGIISEYWIQVRKGEKTLREMIREVEKFKNSNLKLYSYTEYLESCSSITNKLFTVAQYSSKGVVYLGRGEKFRNLQAENLNHDFFVLVTSSRLEEADSDLSNCTSYHFLTLANEGKPNTTYVVLDLDFSEEDKFYGIEITTVRCFHLKGDKVISTDVYGDYVAEASTNFARPTKEGKMILGPKPGKTVVLEMVCPGYCAGTCTSTPVEWQCFSCKAPIEYDFNDYYFCRCGKCLAASFEYRCSNSRHGNSFITADSEFLKKALSELKPFPEMNVLFLGQSGVGKSTFINSIVNYLTYDTMETAVERGVICTIPMSLTVYDAKKKREHVVEMGKEDENEVTTVGHSSTQYPHTYSFVWKKKYVRIIDSPGLGDTGGIEKDKENLRKIIDHLGYFKELHGVCILLKANDNKFNVLFKYCIKELLANLHRSIIKNIVFCFTNSRNSLYSPGKASIVLESVLKDMKIENELWLGPHNTFSFDNEAFLFLCSLQYTDVQHSDIVKASFAESWRISLEETIRLFETIATFEPHFLKETITLVSARNRVLSLTAPMAEVCKTIQQNIALLERKKKEINECDLKLTDMQKKLTMTEIYLESEVLPWPRTVCSSSSCVEYFDYTETDLRETEYKKHCHSVCYITNVVPKTTNNVLLRDCDAMDKNGKCTFCGCGWEMHIHITYSQKRASRPVINKKIEENMNKEKLERDKINVFVSSLESKIEKYKAEEKAIIQASVKFGAFLKQNAITVYNDSVLEYLEYMIEVEKGKPMKSKTEEQVLSKMRNMFDQYKAEVKMIEEVLKMENGEEKKLTIDEMGKLEENLYKLELTGADIKNNVEASRAGSKKLVEYLETPIYWNQNIKTKSRHLVPENENKTLKDKVMGKINKGLEWVSGRK